MVVVPISDFKFYDEGARFALVSFKHGRKWLPIDELDSVSLIDQFLKHDFSDSQIFILSMVAYRLLNECAYNPYVLAASSKIEIFPHQIDEVTKILENTRMMVADEVGLGKTIVAGLIACELNARGLADRILFVVPKSLVK